MPLSSWSHIKGLPRRPAIGSCVMERQRPWETFNRHTSAGTFLFFYLNGVKHLHKWEASQYIALTKKGCLPHPPNFVSKGKESSIYFLNLFCTFCEICSETWTEVKRGLVLHKIPTYSTHPLPSEIKKTINAPHPVQHSKHNFCIFPHYYYFLIKDSIWLYNGVFRLPTATSQSWSSKPNAFMAFFFLWIWCFVDVFFKNRNISPGHRKKTCRDWNLNSGFCQRCVQWHQAQSEMPA